MESTKKSLVTKIILGIVGIIVVCCIGYLAFSLEKQKSKRRYAGAG